MELLIKRTENKYSWDLYFGDKKVLRSPLCKILENLEEYLILSENCTATDFYNRDSIEICVSVK